MSENIKARTATKSRILFLLRYLYENTDDEHAVSTNELIRVLAENGFAANRKVVRDDADMLNDAGYEILIDKDGKSNSYHFGGRIFELPELKMLVDAVSSSRFISAEKSDVLIRKISSLAGRYEAEKLTASIFAADRIKGDNGKVFLITDIANEAINRKKKIAFQYYEYLPTMEKVLRHAVEAVIPYTREDAELSAVVISAAEKLKQISDMEFDRLDFEVYRAENEAGEDDGEWA